MTQEATTEQESLMNTDRSQYLELNSMRLVNNEQVEMRNMLIFLDYYKLELTQVLPTVERIVEKAK